MTLTSRDEAIIAQALTTAAQVLKIRRDPPLSDIADMERLLDNYFPRQKELTVMQDHIHRAREAGMPMPVGSSFSLADIAKWLKDHPVTSSNIVKFEPLES